MPESLPSLDLLDPRLKPQCEAILGALQVPGASVAVVVGDKPYHLAWGVKSSVSGEPVTADTSFNIGSCSKAFASALMASLVAEGLARWDDPISKWVPEFELQDERITPLVTLRDLSANRLGLPRAGLAEFGLDPGFSAENQFSRLKHTPAAFPFRDRFGYVNPGHAANAVAAGRITGKGFLPTLRERILAPLGMTGTSGGAAAPRELSNIAAWHVLKDGRPQLIDTLATDQFLGSGGMAVSGRDALQWLRLHLGGGGVDGQQVIPRDALLETHRPHAVATPGKDIVSLFYPGAQMGAYALGWAVSDFEGHPLVAHSGSDLGITAMTLLLPRDGIGVAVYGNLNAPGSAYATLSTAYAVAATLLGLKPRDWVAYFRNCLPKLPAPSVPVAPAEAPSFYAGTYLHPGDGALDVRDEGGALVCNLRDGYRFKCDLIAVGEHAYRVLPQADDWRGSFGMFEVILKFTVVDGRATQAEMSATFQGRIFVRQADAA
jgi:CubicO group peptidase (beta-lactamase class C family)